MCGIIGFYSKISVIDNKWLVNARDMMSYRGPDNAGFWKSSNNSIQFGHRRLAIIDIKKESNQPLTVCVDDLEYAITFNGEIYNYKELRSQLLLFGYTFKTESDTEVLLYSYIHWGQDFLQKLEGMFSFTIFDPKNQNLFFARDIVGEKPYYYFIKDDNFYFSSEFLPLLSHPILNKEVSITSIIEFLEFGFLNEIDTYNIHIKKLPAGHFGIFDLKTFELEITSYYNIPTPNLNYNLEEAIDKFNNLIVNSVKSQLRSDVPVGVLLSGGIDSSIITCVANALNSNIVNYTVDFGNNEEEIFNAKIISQYYDCKHEIFKFSDISISQFDKIINKIDDPVSDTSFIPTFLISEMISSTGGKVVLGGDGADELFGGYSLYKNLNTIKSVLKHIPSKISLGISDFFDKPYQFNNLKFKKWLLNTSQINKFQLPNIRQSFSQNEIFELLNKFNLHDFELKNKHDYFNSNFSNIYNFSSSDLKNYLGSNILLKNDRSSMLNSIEMRAPFLNKEVVNFSFEEIPDNFKLNKNQSKFFLIEFSRKIFPQGYNYNKKRGFNFTNNLLLSPNWHTYFYNTVSESEMFNQFYVDYLFNLSSKGNNNLFQKIYSLFLICKWIANNNLKVVYDKKN